jgi:hypothetical protein
MHVKRLFEGVGLAVLLVVAMAITIASVTVMPVEAKAYYTYHGHPAVRYEHSDIPNYLKPYIEKVEYDLAYKKGYGYGARLYLTWYARSSINGKNGGYVLSLVTSYVTSRPEWRSDRSYVSVATEIAIHCRMGKISPIDIEYYYQDLAWWEKLAYGR